MRQHINLVNPALLPPKPFFQFRTLALALAATGLLMLSLGVFIHYSLRTYAAVAVQAQARVTQREAQLREQQARLKVREKDPQVALALSASREEFARLQQVAGRLPGQEAAAGAAANLQALAEAAMPGVWLESIALHKGALSLQGYAQRPEQIPEYLERLRRQPVFQGQQFSAFELGRKQFQAADGDSRATPAEALIFGLQAVGSGRRP